MSIIEKFGFGPAAERARLNLKLKAAARPPKSSHKPQAPSALKQTQLKGKIKI